MFVILGQLDNPTYPNVATCPTSNILSNPILLRLGIFSTVTFLRFLNPLKFNVSKSSELLIVKLLQYLILAIEVFIELLVLVFNFFIEVQS